MKTTSTIPKLSGFTWSRKETVYPQILSVMQSYCEAGYIGGRTVHPQWLLDYSFTPFGHFRVGRNSGRWIERTAREAHLYSPNTPYWENTGQAGVTMTQSIFITFLGAEKTDLIKLAPFHSYARLYDAEGRLGDLLSRMLNCARTMSENSFWNAQAILCEIMALLSQAEPLATGAYRILGVKTRMECSEMVAQVRVYFQNHLAEPITRQTMARHCHLSVSAFAHRYRQEAGESPMATLMNMRINLVKGLLLKGQRLKTIAEQTGFCDAFHLSKMFKKREGIAPRQFLILTQRLSRSA